MDLNNLINNRIGLGKFQIQCFLILCLVDMNDGVQLVLSSFLNPIIKAIFPQTNSFYISLLASIFYIGILFGSLSSGFLADLYGRKRLIMSGGIMQIMVSLLFYLATSIQMMLFLRLIYGYAFGFTVAITTSMFAQISPQKYRGKGILLINFCISFGKMYAVGLGYLFLQPNLAQTNWKLMMVCGSLPNLIVVYGSLFVLQESPRFLLAHQKFQQGFEVLNSILKVNSPNNQSLSQLQKQQIRKQFTHTSTDDHFSLKILFLDKNLKITVSLCLCWIIINFCFYGQLVIQAFHLGTKSSPLDLSKYFFTVFGEIPSLLLSFYLIDHPQFGRKNSLTYFFIGAAICHLFFAGFTVVFMGSIARFFMKDVFQILYPLTTESFSTKIRTKGFGFCSGFGRIGAIIMPFIIIPMDSWKRGSVYVLFFFLCLLAALISWKQIEQTMNKNLDDCKERQQLIELSQSFQSKQLIQK